MYKFNKKIYDLLLSVGEENLLKDSEVSNEVLIKKLGIEESDDWIINQFSNFLNRELKKMTSLDDKINFINQLTDKNEEKFSNYRLYNDFNFKNFKNFNMSENFLIKNNLWSHLKWEFENCHEALLISPFISQEMINKLEPILEENENLKIKILTTTFDGKSRSLAITGLIALKDKYKDRIDIKIESLLSGSNKRIHIKAYAFKRESNFGSLYIGSGNFTVTGTITGKEHSIKLSEFREKIVFDDFQVEFDNLWNNESHIDITDADALSVIMKLQSKYDDMERQIANYKKSLFDDQYKFKNYKPFSYQQEIIDNVFKRIEAGKKEHLLVMATGTGKTATIAFIFEKLKERAKNENFKMLYIAPSIEILDQTIQTFKNILKVDEFGTELFASRTNEINFEEENIIFTNTETFKKYLDQVERTSYDMLVIDEVHHLGASTHEEIFSVVSKNAKQIFGLTATPERTDGINVIKYFNDELASNLNLYNAIENDLLSDFDYYFINDNSADLSNIKLTDNKKLIKQLSSEKRNEFVYKNICEKIGTNKRDVKVLVFCFSKEHAESFSNFLNTRGEKSGYLFSGVDSTGETINKKYREKVIQDFKTGEINYLCVVDIFNEGVDIPEIDKILFLRPTNSLILYLQQLGRGLRKQTDKRLEVFDFVNNVDLKINKGFNPLIAITELTKNLKINDITKNLNEISNFLPGESTFVLNKIAKQELVKIIKEYERNYLYTEILKEYRQSGEYTDFEAYFNDKQIDLNIFYEGKINIKGKKTHQRTFFDDYSEPFCKNSIKSFVNFRNVYLIDKFIEIIDTKKKTGNRLIDELFISNIACEKNSNTPYGKKIDDFFKYYLTFDKFLLEVKYVLKYIKRNKSDCFYNEVNSINDLKNEKFNISNIHVILGIRFDELTDELKGTQDSGVIYKKDDNVLAIRCSGATKNTRFGYFNHFDGKVLKWDGPDKWDYLKPTSKQKQFIAGEFNILAFYKSESNKTNAYTFIGFAKFNPKNYSNAGLWKRENGDEYNQTRFVLDIL